MADTTTIEGGPAGAPQAPPPGPAGDPAPFVTFLAKLADTTLQRHAVATYHLPPVLPPVLRPLVLDDGSAWAVLDDGHAQLRWKLRNAVHEGPWRGWCPR